MSPILIPQDLDRDAIMTVLKRLNMLETGVTSFGAKEVSAALRWARVPADQHFRFLAAMEKHDLFWKVSPVTMHKMKKTPALTPGEQLLMTFVPPGVA